jgi:cold shock CspA family protein
VLVSSEVTGTVFAYFSHVQVDGYRSLIPGQEVEFASDRVAAGARERAAAGITRLHALCPDRELCESAG